MKSNEILKLHQRIEKRLLRRDTEKDDKSLAQMADTPGWKALKGLMEGMIAELLEPVEFSDETPLDVRGSIGDARFFALKSLRMVVGSVESTKVANQSEKEAEKEQQENKEGKK